MRGDFSRGGFDPSRHFTRVLMQQGRVQLDADWNEQVAIDRHHERTVLTDLIGRHGGPEDARGFWLIRNETDLEQLAVWDSFGAGEQQRLRDEVGRSGFLLGNGRYYVDGILCELDELMAVDAQPGWPFGGPTGDDRAAVGALVYLDVWERHVTGLEYPEILEVALGGADTATRAQLVWQVKILRDGETADVPWTVRLARTRPALRAKACTPRGRPDPCVVDPTLSYRGAENQLYRVEIHDPGVASPTDGKPGRATFVWSRENGSVVFPVVGVTDAGAPGEVAVELATLGRDRRYGIDEGDVVELLDDDLVLGELPGVLRTVERVDPDTSTVVLRGGARAKPGEGRTKHLLLRRWDHRPAQPVEPPKPGDPLPDGGALPVVESASETDGWIELEDGVCIQFATSGELAREYRTGDYWLIPARTATGDVMWPRHRDGDNEIADFRRPDGVEHHYAPLAIATFDKDGAIPDEQTDLRLKFSTLTALTKQE